MSSKNAKLTGQKMKHAHLGYVEVLGPTPGSNTKVEISVTDRGPGYSKKHNRYKGNRAIRLDASGAIESTAWSRGQNYQHGHTDTVHINDLIAIN